MRRLLAAVCATIALSCCSPSGFSEADVQQIKNSIRDKFNADKNYSVDEVVLIKESATRLTGYVRLHHKLLGEMTRNCNASMAEDGRNYIWRCGS
ncbi:hypothetical protein MCBMB27_02617 [Methylobacterium phyllosphaerae]|uniref:Uncharacterized protein n=1 Tax=Methylobacterium phyllosphaerae TaxID=418223 RepID=A0AAE8L6X5_9HYPH|nr:hypothetical protein [Methylobacterium phyllosphaerae]APT31908.1 hypothetical protein MCBMB27_02617 [Methylobacterium phyllosphaerae]SFH01748.1 hypothetical protein SAMN05192567_11250 [Methylobacterium phyllosphaerae]